MDMQNNHLTQFWKSLYIGALFVFILNSIVYSQEPNSKYRDTALFTNFLSTQTTFEFVRVENKIDFFNFFIISKWLSGTLYFTGNGFQSVIAIRCQGQDSILEKYFERCISGSKVTLDNCAFERDGGMKPITISKTVVFQ